MPRPYEPYADALRLARQIARDRVGDIAEAAVRADPHAYDEACHALVACIAQAIMDASEAARHRDIEAA
ncbi:hypothetical protein MKK84_27540 [Methylobacterium sp. E-065]|uniref:hypothetical protein n=1 Tax=Methylobacterium sp. E-065 TaxID=2836583 RepID=UPI001FBBC930|nr:hypothetical protein [Methylobacterium sp. E-065]MCJ2021128.1 hypothetical protein [Methylobacterium sp. E-065]